MKVILDTNVVISAVYFGGAPLIETGTDHLHSIDSSGVSHTSLLQLPVTPQIPQGHSAE